MIQDFKRNNKIALRNFSENQDKHDIIRTLLVRMLRRNYPNNSKVQIYTEFDQDNQNKRYPDILLTKYKISKGKLQTEKIAFEIQDKITKDWTKKITEQYSDIDLVIIPVKNLSDNIRELKKELEVYLV